MTPTATWDEHGTARTARWRAENGATPPREIVVIHDDIAADDALRLARAGTGLLWRGDFHNARQLLRALDRRLQKRAERTQRAARKQQDAQSADLAHLFHANRSARAQRAAILGKILIELEPDHTIRLRRAPDVRAACQHAYGRPDEDAPGSGSQSTLVSLPELLGVVSAYEWHRTGIEIAALGARIHPAYSVFAPTRDEYIDLVAKAPWPESVDAPSVLDLGTGTGVLAAVLAQRGAHDVVATDINPRAVRCARENVERLGLADRVRVEESDLWPAETRRVDLVVCNPPWVPGRPTSALEQGIYDRRSDMLHRFLDGLSAHLTPQGEGWLILSDLAEHLGLRTRDQLLDRIAAAELTITGSQHTIPRHSRASDADDLLHAARSRERTTLWRLAARSA